MSEEWTKHQNRDAFQVYILKIKNLLILKNQSSSYAWIVHDSFFSLFFFLISHCLESYKKKRESKINNKQRLPGYDVSYT